ncbi:hypothetical protein HYC85_003647, partial [Camellia sinensis]
QWQFTKRVKFNIGGKIFETTTTTLANGGCNSFFAAMFDNNWNLQTHNSAADDDGDYFIDRNPNCFAILNLLRTRELYIPSNIPENLFHREALFYGLLDNVCVRDLGSHPTRLFRALFQKFERKPYSSDSRGSESNLTSAMKPMTRAKGHVSIITKVASAWELSWRPPAQTSVCRHRGPVGHH